MNYPLSAIVVEFGIAGVKRCVARSWSPWGVASWLLWAAAVYVAIDYSLALGAVLSKMTWIVYGWAVCK